MKFIGIMNMTQKKFIEIIKILIDNTTDKFISTLDYENLHLFSRDITKYALTKIYQIEPKIELNRINGVIYDLGLNIEHKFVSKLLLYKNRLRNIIKEFQRNILYKNLNRLVITELIGNIELLRYVKFGILVVIMTEDIINKPIEEVVDEITKQVKKKIPKDWTELPKNVITILNRKNLLENTRKIDDIYIKMENLRGEMGDIRGEMGDIRKEINKIDKKIESILRLLRKND